MTMQQETDRCPIDGTPMTVRRRLYQRWSSHTCGLGARPGGGTCRQLTSWTKLDQAVPDRQPVPAAHRPHIRPPSINLTPLIYLDNQTPPPSMSSAFGKCISVFRMRLVLVRGYPIQPPFLAATHQGKPGPPKRRHSQDVADARVSHIKWDESPVDPLKLPSKPSSLPRRTRHG